MRTRFQAWLALLAVLVVSAPAGGVMDAAGEHEIKAAFLFNFAKFTNWPGETARRDPLLICVAGEDPFGKLLDETVRNKQVRGRDLAVERRDIEGDLTDCEIVFIGGASPEQRWNALKSLEGHPVLTIGEARMFTYEGGMIGFFKQQRHVRFAINVEAIDRSELRISSKLLQLARDPLEGL